MNYVNGHKTIICMVIMIIMESDLVKNSMATDAYHLSLGIMGLLTAGSLAHRLQKGATKKTQ